MKPIHPLFGYTAVVLAMIFAVALVAQGTWAQTDSPRSSRRKSDNDPKSELQRREGDHFKGIGGFAITGDRITFYPNEGEEAIRALENLALERVSRILEKTRGKSQWEVEGVITEYRGGNYILVSRAVLKAKESAAP